MISTFHDLHWPIRLYLRKEDIIMAVETRGAELQRACIALYVVSGIAIGLRCYVRTQMIKHFGLDDWFMLTAFVSSGPCFFLEQY